MWSNIFGKNNLCALVKQSFLRLMGMSGTIEHADYYYFKRDTHIFDGEDGLNAMKAAIQYYSEHNLYDNNIFEYKKEFKENDNNDYHDDYDNKNNEQYECGICNKIYNYNDLDDNRKKTYENK